MAGELEEGPPAIYIMHFGEEFKGGIEEAIGYLLTHSKLHFAEKKAARTAPGSIILFTAEGKLFGEAIATTGLQETSPEDLDWLREKYGREYRHVVELDKNSIRIYPRFLEVREVEDTVGKRRSRVFTYIEPSDYVKILARVYAGV